MVQPCPLTRDLLLHQLVHGSMGAPYAIHGSKGIIITNFKFEKTKTSDKLLNCARR